MASTAAIQTSWSSPVVRLAATSVRTLHTLRAIDRFLAVVRSRAESVATPRGSFLAV